MALLTFDDRGETTRDGRRRSRHRIIDKPELPHLQVLPTETHRDGSLDFRNHDSRGSLEHVDADLLTFNWAPQGRHETDTTRAKQHQPKQRIPMRMLICYWLEHIENGQDRTTRAQDRCDEERHNEPSGCSH